MGNHRTLVPKEVAESDSMRDSKFPGKELILSGAEASGVRTFELYWEDYSAGDDELFPDGLEWDETVFYHGTSSTREDAIDRQGLIPHAGGVGLQDVRALVACYDQLGWAGLTVNGCPVLKAYSLVNDFRDGDSSPLYLSGCPSQAIHFAIPSTAGGEKLAACRVAIAGLRRFLSDTALQESEKTRPEQWARPEAPSELSDQVLENVKGRLANLAGLERRAQEELDNYRYAVIYAIRPPIDAPSRWQDCRGMGWRVSEPIPPSWFVAKLRVYPPPSA